MDSKKAFHGRLKRQIKYLLWVFFVCTSMPHHNSSIVMYDYVYFSCVKAAVPIPLLLFVISYKYSLIVPIVFNLFIKAFSIRS